MNDERPASIDERKGALRREVLVLRRAQPDKDVLSETIARRLMALAEYQAAGIVMFYVDARSEVRTRGAIRAAIASGKFVAVPQCVGDELVPWQIASLDELAAGAFGIAEPSAALRAHPDRKMSLELIDLVIVPGVAFDRRGGRVGSGRGFYDRFIARLNDRAVLVGLAFDCQIVDEVPTAAHDVPMDIIVTPSAVIKRHSDLRAM